MNDRAWSVTVPDVTLGRRIGSHKAPVRPKFALGLLVVFVTVLGALRLESPAHAGVAIFRSGWPRWYSLPSAAWSTRSGASSRD